MVNKNGKNIWVSDVSYPWFDKDNKVIGFVGCLRDITERVRAEKLFRDKLVKMASSDCLTGLANRRSFFSSLETAVTKVKKNNSPLSILLIDIDHFKNINDTYGHHSGDEILVEIAEQITSCLRKRDIAARIGGEEFGVFLPETSIQDAYALAEVICTSIARHKFVISKSLEPISCTVSIGVSCSSIFTSAKTLDLYKIADTRLYIAKNTGRNQVSADEVLCKRHIN